MKALLEHDVDVNCSDWIFRQTLLHIASRKDERSDFVKLLLQQPHIEVNATTALHRFTPLHMAARFTCPKVVELLLNDRRVVIDAKTVDGLTALHLVAEGREDLDSNPRIIRSQEDRCNVVRLLLEAEKQRRSSNVDCHLNQSDVLKRLPIHYAVEWDSAEVVKELLKWTDTAINAQDIYGLGPLHLATRSKANNREAIVALLLDVHNIDINIKSVMSSAIEQSRSLNFCARLRSNRGSNVFLPFLLDQTLEQDVKDFTPLHLAAQHGHVGVVERLLQLKGPSQLALVDGAANTSVHLTSESGHSKEEMLLEPAANEVNINGTNNDGNTPLHLASEEGHVEMVQVLLEHISKSGFNWKNNDGNTPLHLATNSGHAEVVKLLLEHTTFKLIFNGEDNNIGNTLLHHATKNGHVEVVEVLLQQTTFKLNLNEKNDVGDTPLHLACGEGHDKVVHFLLENVRELDFNAKNNDGNTPLHLAIDNGNVEVVKVLLGCVALELNFNGENDDGNKALQLASKEGHVSKLHFNEKNGDQDTPLHLASKHGHVEVVNMLLDVCGATELKLNSKNGDENTPLHLAADEGHVGVVNLLLKHVSLDFQGRRDVQNHDTKPNLAEKNRDGNTPLHLASKEGHEEVVGAILLSKCVNKSILNAINEDGNTPLHLATKNGHANVVTKMLEDAPKFDLNAKNKNGHTPLHFATRKCHLHVVKALCLGQQLRANLEDGSGKTCLQYAKDQQDDNIKLEEIANILTERSDVKDFLDGQYRDRQVFIDAANALLVGGALIAGITFASWLQPPLGYITYYQFHQSYPGTPANTFEAFAGLEMHYSLRLFWVFNTLSFFFAIATVISGAKAAFPDLDAVFIVESLRSVRRELQWTSILLVCAVVTVLGAFVCAGFAILPPIQRDVRNMKISVIIGLVICRWTIFKFLMKLFRTMAKVIKRYKATSRKQQTKDEKLWVWLLQSVKFMHKPREDEDEEIEVTAATRLNTRTGSHLLVKTSKKSSQCVEYVGEGVNSYDVGAIQGNGPARHPRRRYYYFEITIKDCGLDGRIGIGFTDEDFKNYRQPGWESNSYGYHGDDGALFHDGGFRVESNFGPTFSTNDIVGAGIDHLKQNIFFTKNGKLVGHCIPNEVRNTLYPTIGLHSRGEKVEVNFGQEKFEYNVDLNAKC